MGELRSGDGGPALAVLTDAEKAAVLDELIAASPRLRYGYVEPTEAAWALLEEAVQPWIEDIVRLLRIGLPDAARRTGLGILGGLHRCLRHKHHDLLLSWAPDFPAEAAAGVLRALDDAGLDMSGADVERVAPGWA